MILLTPPRPRENTSALKQNSPKIKDKENVIAQQKVVSRKTPSALDLPRKPSALGDRTTQIRNAENSWAGAPDKSVSETDRSKGSVRDRMREWELERARLPVRKSSRLGDILPPVLPPDAHSSPIRSGDPFTRTVSTKLFKQVNNSTAPPTSMPRVPVDTDVPLREWFARNASTNESSLNLFKQSLKAPLVKTVDIYKSSVGMVGRRLSTTRPGSPQRLSDRPSWENEILEEANSSLPIVQQAARNRRIGADNQADRMTIWLQNVEKVVADARQNFASSNVSLLPPLPVPPGPQTRRSSRDRSQWPSRRVLPPNQVFQVEEGSSVDQSFASSSNLAQNDQHNIVLTDILPTGPREGPGCSAFSYDGPRPTRRATVLGRTPEKPCILNIDADMTPSKRREKSKSANDLNRLIRPISKVQFELDKLAAKSNLSAVLDRDLFTPDPVPIDPDSSWSSNDHATAHSPARNSLTDSPFVVHPYPSRKQAVTPPAMNSPTRRDLEGVYDRLLMATSGVKRVGKGYQSCHVKPISTNISPSSSKNPGRFFHSTRRPMPPPVSSEDTFMTGPDEPDVNVDGPVLCEDHAGAAKVVSRALKALVAGKVVKKASRTS